MGGNMLSSSDKIEVLNLIITLVKEQDIKMKQLAERLETIELSALDKRKQTK